MDTTDMERAASATEDRIAALTLRAVIDDGIIETLKAALTLLPDGDVAVTTDLASMVLRLRQFIDRAEARRVCRAQGCAS